MILEAAFTELRRIKRWVRRQAQLSTIDYDPYDKQSCERLAEKMFHEQSHPGYLGSVERSRNLLRIIGDSYPTARLTNAYFENLSALLERRPKLAEPGRLLIGLSTGRSGSTTLALLLAEIP